MARLDRTQKGTDAAAQKLTRFDEIFSAAHATPPVIAEAEAPEPEPEQGKGVAKRDDPNFMQCTFRIRKRTSRQLNRVLMDLGDEGTNLDRSELLEEMLQTFFRLHSQMGASEALQMVKHLGTQNEQS